MQNDLYSAYKFNRVNYALIVKSIHIFRFPQVKSGKRQQ